MLASYANGHGNEFYLNQNRLLPAIVNMLQIVNCCY